MIKKMFLILMTLCSFQSAIAKEYLKVGDILKLPRDAATKRIAYGKDPLQFGDLRLPEGKGPFPVVILIHGGCWLSKFANLEIMSPLATAFKKAGIATWNIEYRPVDNAGGGWPGTFQDVGNGIDYLKNIASQYHLKLKRVVLVGHSAGGQLALWGAARHKLPQDSVLFTPKPLPIHGVIDLAGPPNLISIFPLQRICDEDVITEMMGGTPSEVPQRYREASASELLPLGMKQILITGRDDLVVPPTFGKEYQRAAKKKGDAVSFIIVDDAAHMEPISPESNMWPYVKKSTNKLLGGK